MNTSNIITGISRHVTLDEAEQRYFISLLLPHRLKQGELIETEGEQSLNFIIVHTGCLMTFYRDKQGNDHVARFATAGWWTGDLESLSKQTPSAYYTKALSDSEVYLLSSKDMEQLLIKVPAFERYFRIIYQNSLITHQNRVMQNLSATAEERYTNFLAQYPNLEQYIPLKYIASYLGFTPEFLSKIRRKMMEH